MAARPGQNSPDKDIPVHGIEKKGDAEAEAKAKEGENIPSKDVPVHGIEKKGDAGCGHSYCRGDACRLDQAEAAVGRLLRRLDAFG